MEAPAGAPVARPGLREPDCRWVDSAGVWGPDIHLAGIVLRACDRHAGCGERVAALVVQDQDSEPDRYAGGCSALEAVPV